MTDIEKIFELTTYLEQFKKLERWFDQYWWRDYPHFKDRRRESDADHTWRMAMMLVLLEKELGQPIDFRKAMIMALIHDIPELIAGDLASVGAAGEGNSVEVLADKFAREKAAAQEIFGKAPEPLGAELYAIWLEFEAKETFESKLITALDKLEGKLQALEYSDGHMYEKHYQFSVNYAAEIVKVDPATLAFDGVLIDRFKKAYKEHKG